MLKPTLADVVLVPHVSSLLTAWLTRKERISLVVWALESGLDDGARPLRVTTPWFGEDEEAKNLFIRCAAASGCRVALSRLLSSRRDRLELPPGVVYEAAKRGDSPTVQWLSTFVGFAAHEAMVFAAANSHVDLAWWIAQNAVATDHTREKDMEVHCIGEMQVEALTWSVQEKDDNNQTVYIRYFATRTSGMISVQRGDERSYVGAMDMAAREGNVPLLQRMQDDPLHQWSCTPFAIDSAAAHGHLHVLQWLRQYRPELRWTQSAMDSAARHGHLNAMTFLRDQLHLSPMCGSTFLAAIEGGHMDVLTWIHDHDTNLASLQPPVCRPRLVEAACVSGNRLQVLRWLEDMYDIRFATKPAMSFVLSQGDVATAQWLADPVGDGAHLAQWDWVVAKWMSYEFALWHTGTFAKAAANGQLHIVEWLAHAGPFHKVDTDTLWQCAMRGYLDIVEFILQRPQHQPKGLVFLPTEWSSFDDVLALTKEEIHQQHSRTEWDRAGCDPPWARRYVQLWMLYRPAECKQVKWLADWARYCGYYQLSDQLTT